MNRTSIESGFITFADRLIRWKWGVLLAVVILTALLFSHLPKITIDTSNEGFLRADDPVLLQYNEFREQFGREEVVLIAIRPVDLFAPEFLTKLKQFHAEIEATVPHLDEVTSLVNVRYTVGKDDELLVEDLLEAFPDSDEGRKQLKQAALNHPFYQDLLISENGALTTVVIETRAFSEEAGGDALTDGFEDAPAEESATAETERTFLTDEENGEVVAAVMQLVEAYQGEDFPIEVAGSPIVMEVLKKSMQSDMRQFTLTMVAIIFLFLFLLFRRVTGILTPLVVVILSLVATIALMALSGTALKLPTQILPSFVLAVGVGDSVHILSIFYRRYDHTGDKLEAIRFALGHSGLAVVMTSLTTAAGLFSFSTAELGAVAELGVFGAAGVLLAMFYSLILLPTLLAIFPVRRKHHKSSDSEADEEGNTVTGMMDRLLNRAVSVSTNHAATVVFVAAILFIVAIAGITQLQFKHDVMKWLPEEIPIRVATDHLDRDLNGTISVEVIVDSGEQEGLYNPQIIGALSKIQDELDHFGDELNGLDAGKRISVIDVLRETNQALNENQAAYYVTPKERQLIAQELLLFENSGSDDLENLVDSELRTARITLRLPWRDAGSYTAIVDEVQERVDQALPEGVESQVTGLMMIFARTLDAMMTSMAQSYTIAAFVVTMMMILLVGHIRLGLISMVPNLLPITIVLGFMGITGLPLDAFTMLIGSIALGLAVDDTVHFMHNFQRYYRQSGDTVEAITHTLHTAGRAMVVTTIVLSLGFLIFMRSDMNNLINFGGLTGMAIILALLADLLLAPALMTLVFGKRN
ncbi:MAG: MMPL family transporter [Gammaproteobacteria bacterium]|nr:MMPL family transporter [Gammaproteobacteria bacterium]MBT3489149.1 MMPL family transporter [Gammaproteobacteria bacterium]MBT3719354.1 MMPL family transporter [Gammaproteobacteria bacterium]MBT3845340.1 MMPL family transporter [Gammaproteobacteria bacterium]MBT3892498.1 MMPL family transporter [Gammaproteobacteria bacterium]